MDTLLKEQKILRFLVMERIEGYRGNEGLGSYIEYIKVVVQLIRGEYFFSQCIRISDTFKDRLYLRL